MHFARIEIGEMMGQLLARFLDIQLASEPTWLASEFMSGPTHVPIRFTPSSPVGAH